MRRSLAVVCGVDEAGRGPLAGPVYAAAVVLDPAHPIRGLKDSKQLLPEVREELREKIFARARAWYIAYATVAEIDTLNILGASLLAMQRAVAGLGFQPEETLIDGNRLPDIPGNVRCIVRGDAKTSQSRRHRSWPRRRATPRCAGCINSSRSTGSTSIRGMPPPSI